MKLSISSKAGAIVALTLSITLVAMISAMIMIVRASQINSTDDQATNLGDFMVKSLAFSMSEGANDVQPFIESVKGLKNLADLQVRPVDKIKPGSEESMDASEKSVLLTGKSISSVEDFRNQSVYRVIEPVKANEKCNSCHGTETGDVIAVVSLRYSLAGMESSLATQRFVGILSGLIAIALTFFVSMYFIKKRIIVDLDKSIADIQRLSDGDASKVAEIKRNDEVGNLNFSLRKLQEALSARAEIGTHFAEGNIGDEVNLLSENDVLGKAFRKLKTSLSNLVADGKALSQAAVQGRLHDRPDSSRHEGEFRKIVEDFNATLDAVVYPIDESSDVLERIARGDLTARVEGAYNGDYAIIKKSINMLGDSFCTAISEVASAVQSTSTAAEQISSSSEEMYAGAQEQSGQAAEVATAMEEMTKTILETTKNSSTAAQSAKDAGAIAKDGGKAVTDTVEGMNRIAGTVKKSAKTVQALGKNSEAIGEIVQVIEEIADQTNLLALNAAIEAARAGEHGRGFAVVADEVRKLADRTTKATKEIGAMITQIQTDTSAAVETMDEGTAEVERGIELTQRAGESLKNIIKAAERVVDVITQVAAASEQQSSTAEEISRNVEAISHVAQENAGGVQQIAKAADNLNTLTLSLQEMVSKFKVEETQKKAQVTVPLSLS